MADKASRTLENFITRLRSTHTPRTERFEVSIFAPKGSTNQPFGPIDPAGRNLAQPGPALLTLNCEEAQLPGYSATNLPVKVGAWTEFRNQNLEFLAQDATFSFLVDQDWFGRSYIERWIEYSVSPTSKEIAYYEDTVGKIEVRSLDMQDNVIAQWSLHEAVPKLISLTPVSWNNVGLMRMSASFACKYWTHDF